MKYFLHDTNSFDDEKITELFLNFGYEGLGLFYTLLEKIAKQEKPIKTMVLKSQLRIGKRLEKCWCFMENIGLIMSKDGETFNEQLLNYSEKYQIKKEKTRIKVSEWRDKQENKNNVTSYTNDSNTIKVKKSKEKNIYNHLIDGGWTVAESQFTNINKVYPKLFLFTNPLKFTEHQNLIKKYGRESVEIIYNEMQNYKDLLKKSESAYLTATNWLNRKKK